MSGLSELLPGPKQVEIDGKKYEVVGLDLMQVARLLGRFPVLDKVFSGKGPGNVAELLESGNPAVGAIIAAGLGHAGDEEWEKDAAALAAQDQVHFLAPIMTLTMPRGFGPFAQDLGMVLTALFPPSPEQMKERVLAKAMQKRSAASSNAGAAPMTPSGSSPQDSLQPTSA
jgi:hypothetical protein